MYQIEFQTNGNVRVFIMEDGSTLSASGPVNVVAANLPEEKLVVLREMMAEFLDITGVRKLRGVA